MIRIATSIPESFDDKAEYVFRFFSALWGIPVAISRYYYGAEKPDVLYSSNHQHRYHGAVCIPFDERLYDAGCQCESVQHDGHTLWSRPDADSSSIDVVAGTYRLLTLLDERQVPAEARDGRGTFFSHALPVARRRTARLPLADHHARYLLQQLTKVRADLAQVAIPKWPGGKKYAIAMTHDTDAVSLGAVKELGTNLAKFLLRRDRVFLDMLVSGLRYIGKPTENPFFGFPLWREFEASRQFYSCFYLFAKVVPLKRDINNCKSSVVEQRIDWDILRRMAASGWEFGFHAPIDPENKLDAFVAGKQWIEEKLGTPIYGLRHHYWALDWTKPQVTFRNHIDAGFRYDTSIAWKDITGFRAATCHPFRPFDPEQDKPLGIHEIPTCLMDGHIIEDPDDVSVAVEEGLGIVRQVQQQGGVAVLDWHTETACNAYNYRNHLTVLRHILEPLLEDGDAWVTTPWEIARHWQRRSVELEAA
jgi:peptidoglycan/xylan/chitin deacetylase (PgdA/CDA1 family)